jgi:glutaryl-CoA dehydrogenase (non-decarboxylating)
MKMRIELTLQQKEARAAFRAFVDREISPDANQFDQEERIPSELIRKMAECKYLAMAVPKENGGVGADMITFGLLGEELGRGCPSVGALLTVHGMVTTALARWGNPKQKAFWLPKMATGETIGAFALTEPNIGCDAKGIETVATCQADKYVLNGEKRWITFGQVADVFLVFAQADGKTTAFLVEKDAPGLSIIPLRGLLGLRASMLAELHLDGCLVSQENVVGGQGFGFVAVAMSALDLGRYSVATSCVGIGQACLEASLQYTCERKQFGVALKEHQLIREMIANMATHVKAARLLCYHAGYLKDINDQSATAETLVGSQGSQRRCPNSWRQWMRERVSRATIL